MSEASSIPSPAAPKHYGLAPASLIGWPNVEKLHAAGYRIVPDVPTRAMRKAAAQAIPHRERGDTDGGPWLNSKDKAAIRYEAMLAAWDHDHMGSTKGIERRRPHRWSRLRRLVFHLKWKIWA